MITIPRSHLTLMLSPAMSRAAASPLSRSLQARITYTVRNALIIRIFPRVPLYGCQLTLAPRSARPRAVSLPIPVLAPVTMVTHPVRSTWSSGSLKVITGHYRAHLRKLIVHVHPHEEILDGLRYPAEVSGAVVGHCNTQCGLGGSRDNLKQSLSN